ncbi:uncharacterized protein LOC132042818 [Lycium ferocissimum]|uniref:uncharacterized protein LOC132042818 n=1 Tax=Lycium ferocissimum TaxID=112874 RepID=UPI002815BC1E|nr:uncharacterized protein LOC132042818 [Lycium ferocissimum]
MEKFYRGLDPITQSIVNNASDGEAGYSADIGQLAANISLLINKFDENQAKKVNVFEDTSGNYNNNNNNFGNRSSNPNIPPKGQSNDQGSLRVEAMLEKVLENQTKFEKTLSWLTEIVRSHTVAIQNLNSKMRDIFREQHPPKMERLSSDTILNPKNGGGSVDHVFAISTRSGKILQSAKKKIVDLDPINEVEEVQSNTPIIVDEVPSEEKVVDIPLVKNKEDAKFEKFYDQLKQLSLNFPFLDDVKEMPDFAKYLKDLLTKKKMVQYETVSLTHTVSSIISTTNVQKKGDPRAFTIPCSVGYYDFARALCDNGASINLMPLAIYKKSGLGMPRPTTMRLQMADRSIKRPVGVVDDFLVRVGKFMFPVDFFILDYVVDWDIPIILERPFLDTRRELMDLKKNEFRYRDYEKSSYEFRYQAYESAALYKERMKHYHNKKIIKREFYKGYPVLLYNSRLKLLPSMLK